MKYIYFFCSLVIITFFIGCNQKDKSGIPDKTTLYDKVCIDGVVYIESYRKLSVYISPKTLKPVRCSDFNLIKK
jgi:hypothetical protein